MNHPSIFLAFTTKQYDPNKSLLENTAKHGLVFLHTASYGYLFDGGFSGETIGPRADNPDIDIALLRGLNPEIVVLALCQWYAALADELPENHQWWLRINGDRVPLGDNKYRLDPKNVSLQDHVAKRAAETVAKIPVDGVFMDWMRPALDGTPQQTIVRKVRQTIGSKLLLINGGERQLPLGTVQHCNGIFMENVDRATWGVAVNALKYNEKNCRTPHINCFDVNNYAFQESLMRMRASTVVPMIYGNCFSKYGDYNDGSGDNLLHKWYPFWDNKVGKAVGSVQAKGAFQTREYEGGTAVYLPAWSTASTSTITFSAPKRSSYSGVVGTQFTLKKGDGDVFLKL